MSRSWIYHATEEPKIINDEDLPRYLQEGWAESPAAFFDMRDHGLNPEDKMLVQATGEALRNVAKEVNELLNLGDLSKDELIDFAERHYDVSLDKRLGKEKMIEKIKKLAEMSGENQTEDGQDDD